ncbi:MAG: acetolactate synthase isozyme 1 small subunit [Desulfovibrionaceae bacterium]
MTRLALLVANRPGVMARVMNLFARRACNVEGILCLPGDDGTSRVWLTLAREGGDGETGRLEVLLRQVRQLQDVFEARQGGADQAALTRVARTFGG